jgi:hypothetical protein
VTELDDKPAKLEPKKSARVHLNLSADRFASGLGLVGAGIFYVAPSQLSPFLGCLFIGAGFFVWLSDVHIVNGHLTAAEPKTIPERIRLMWPQFLMFIGAAVFVLGLVSYVQRESHSDDGRTIARLTALGWTIKPGQDDVLFEVADRSLPPMAE